MIKSIIIIIISFFIDTIFINIFSSTYSNLNIYTSSIIIGSLIIIYPLFKRKTNKYYILLFILGIIYDLLFTNFIILHSFIFLILGYLIKILYKYLEYNSITLILYTIIVLVSYEILYALILYLYNIVPISIEMVLYKIKNSILLNIIYMELVYIISKIISKNNIIE